MAKIPKCKKCKDTKWIDAPRWGIGKQVKCNGCCDHYLGWYKLEFFYGEDNGKWCCKSGCGLIIPLPFDKNTLDLILRWNSKAS